MSFHVFRCRYSESIDLGRFRRAVYLHSIRVRRTVETLQRWIWDATRETETRMRRLFSFLSWLLWRARHSRSFLFSSNENEGHASTLDSLSLCWLGIRSFQIAKLQATIESTMPRRPPSFTFVGLCLIILLLGFFYLSSSKQNFDLQQTVKEFEERTRSVINRRSKEIRSPSSSPSSLS